MLPPEGTGSPTTTSPMRSSTLSLPESRRTAKVLYLGPDRAANLVEVVSVLREDGTEIVIHAMRMRPKYEPFLRGEGDSDV